ncbi:protoporphyrinogen/coproporphyrinogen oxidase, partial [Ornithinicoccus halotolerans]|uniref:protoporphyrinogen/coproporphyrinogen oxidase n=1 Tax=Ornithinicoccus halotolerans TaxID=1748220 RepID=UPI001886234B
FDSPVVATSHDSGVGLSETGSMLAGSGAGGAEAGPVFAGLPGGLHRLVDALAAQLRARGVTIRADTVVRELQPVPETDLWQLVTGPVPNPTGYLAERVVLALPPAPAGRLLQPHAPVAAARLQRVPTASMAVVTLALPAAATPELPGSGLLVPPVEGRTVKAATFSAGKWDWVREAGRGAAPGGGDLLLLRASVGRHREEAALQHDDGELVHRVLHDLGDLVGAPIPHPVDSHVQRWGGALPQYPVGHPAVVAEVLTEVAGLAGVEVAGAAYQGVGVPACIGSGRAAARRAAGLDADGDSDRGVDPG